MKIVADLRDRFGVEPILRVLGVAPSTFYGWLARQAEPADREQVDRALVSEIADVHDRSGATYGSPRVHATLRRRGINVSRKRVERLMRTHGLQGAFLRRGWRGGSTRQNPKATPAPDLVNRDFTAPGPNRLWVADATRIICGDGCCGWPRSVMCSPTASSAGRPPTGVTQTSCWAPWSTGSGRATYATAI